MNNEIEKRVPFDWVDFIENTPPYKKIEIKEYQLFGMSQTNEICIDSYCFNCEKERTFKYSKCNASDMTEIDGQFDGSPFGIMPIPGDPNPTPKKSNLKPEYEIYKELDFYCVKCKERHEYFFTTDRNIIYKVGQNPSFGDLAGNEINKYKNLISKYFTEFKTSLNLYSQGKGIGSFVYLRRILEDIIEKQYKTLENQDINDGFKEKMEKVQKKYHVIPDEFDNIKNQLYSVLSKGIHEYEEKECLDMYDSVKFIIEDILDNQLKNKERKDKINEATKKIIAKTGENN